MKQHHFIIKVFLLILALFLITTFVVGVTGVSHSYGEITGIPTIPAVGTCPSGQYVTGYSSTGVIQCSATSSVTGSVVGGCYVDQNGVSINWGTATLSGGNCDRCSTGSTRRYLYYTGQFLCIKN